MKSPLEMTSLLSKFFCYIPWLLYQLIRLLKAALRKLTKDEVIALTLEYQAKFDNTLSNINRELSELRNDFKKVIIIFARPIKMLI